MVSHSDESMLAAGPPDANSSFEYLGRVQRVDVRMLGGAIARRRLEVADRFDPRTHAKLLVGVLQVLLHGVYGHRELAGDLVIA